MCTPSWITTLALYARRGLSTMYVRNRAPTKAPDGRTSCEVLYDMKPEPCELVYIRRTVCHRRIEREFEAGELWVELRASAGHSRYLCNVRT